jgi:hypothetical protein
MNGLQRYLALEGMSANSLSPQVSDPTPQIDAYLKAICILYGIPKRVFEGSERGELASSQDAKAWYQRMQNRQENYLTPRMIVPFVDRLILLGVLAEPKLRYHVEWPESVVLTEDERASIALTTTDSITKFVQGGGDNLMTERDFMTKILEMPESEADAILEAKMEELEEEQALEGEMFEEEPVEEETGGPPANPKKPSKDEPLAKNHGDHDQSSHGRGGGKGEWVGKEITSENVQAMVDDFDGEKFGKGLGDAAKDIDKVVIGQHPSIKAAHSMAVDVDTKTLYVSDKDMLGRTETLSEENHLANLRHELGHVAWDRQSGTPEGVALKNRILSDSEEGRMISSHHQKMYDNFKAGKITQARMVHETVAEWAKFGHRKANQRVNKETSNLYQKMIQK